MEAACALCAKPATEQCPSCLTVAYCGEQHRCQHWAEHKSDCSVYTIAKSEKLGRHMVAKRNIAAGEVILKEPPLVWGPKVYTSPLCLGCNRKLTATSPCENTPKTYYHCRSCNWPLCSQRCENHAVHQLECKILAKTKHRRYVIYKEGNETEPAYCVITPLRCLLLSEERLNQVLSLTSNLEARINTTLYKAFKINIVDMIRKTWGLTQYSEATILKIAAILDTNSFEIDRAEETISMRGLYHQSSMMSHDCLPNAKNVFLGNKYTMVVTATTDIKKGETISTSYLESMMWSTFDRRYLLKQSKCFECDCIRCRDVSEFRTYFSCIYCSKCRSYMLCVNPLDSKSDWKCSNCTHVIRSKEMVFGNEAYKREISSTGKTVQNLESLLKKYLAGALLHPSNCHVVQVKDALVNAYCKQVRDVDIEALERAECLCTDLLELTEKLDPGLSRYRGDLMLRQLLLRVHKIKAEFNGKLITKEKAHELLVEERRLLLTQIAPIVKTEPDLKKVMEEREKEMDTLCSMWDS